jgi:hypothetical protein
MSRGLKMVDMSMSDTLVSFETAKLAKKKGFSGRSNFYYIKSKVKVHYSVYHQLHFSNIAATSQGLLQRWIREVHKIHITITSISQESWMYRITKPGQQLIEGSYGEDFYTYEEALEEGLFQALKLIKNE